MGETGLSVFNVPIVTWASLTSVLAGLLIFRALIGLGSGQEHVAREQQTVQSRTDAADGIA